MRAGGELLPLEPLPARLAAGGWGARTTPAEDARRRFELEHVEQPWADRPADDEGQRLADALLRATANHWEMWELLAAGPAWPCSAVRAPCRRALSRSAGRNGLKRAS